MIHFFLKQSDNLLSHPPSANICEISTKRALSKELLVLHHLRILAVHVHIQTSRYRQWNTIVYMLKGGYPSFIVHHLDSIFQTGQAFLRQHDVG